MKHRRGGFTMTEMLITVGILAVLLAVAVPAIVTVRGNLKMQELDKTAREIYLAAQNTLTARKAASVELSSMGTESVTQGTEYRWLSSSDGTAAALLPAGTIESVAAGKYYMIWYDATTATVREVYYAESSLLEADIKNMVYSDLYDNGSNSAKEKRREDKIGYYSGKVLEQGDVVPLLPPTLKIDNGMDLTVTVTVPSPKDYALAGVKLAVTVEGLDQNGGSYKFSGPYDPGTGEYELTLDSLTNGHFQAVCNGKITPGANIRVTAELEGLADTDKAYLPASIYEDTNSLFAGRSGDTVYIANPRHLQNLAPEVSGVEGNGRGTYYAEQTAEIDWDDAPVDRFLPIDNVSLHGYNGNGNEIKDLRIDSAPHYGAGLFGVVLGAKLENIRLVDPVVDVVKVLEPGGTLANVSVGALVGSMDSYFAGKSAVIDCQVYATGGGAMVASGCANAGGLIGSALRCAVTNSSASLPKIGSGKTDCVGGLIGNAGTDCTVTGCYADTGWMDSDTKKWDPSYGLTGESIAAIGGLIGNAGKMSIKDCYAVGWLTWNGTAEAIDGDAGLVGNVNDTISISSSYSILQNKDGNSYYTYTTAKEKIDSLSDLSDKFWWAAVGGTTPYHKDICDGDYPYPRLGLRHYGDWPSQSVDGIRLFDGNDATSSNELKFIMVPVESVGLEEGQAPTVTFYAEAQNAGKAAKQQVTVEIESTNTDIIHDQTSSGYDGSTGRTKVVLIMKAEGPCVTYVDLKSDECTLRVAAIVYRATVELTGTNGGGSDPNSNVTSTASTTGVKVTNTLILRSGDPNRRKGTLEAEMAVEPSLDGIKEEIGKMRPTDQDTFVLSVPDPIKRPADFEKLFDCWEKVCDGDPKVTANGDPDNEANILAPVKDEAGNITTYYPDAKNDGGSDPSKLTVTGESSGTAMVAASWAMNSSPEAKLTWTLKEPLEAECEVKLVGARALIEKVQAKGTEKSNYPYRLDLTAEPKEEFTLEFTPKLFGGGVGEEEYTWSVIRTGSDENVTLTAGPNVNKTSDPSVEDGKWSFTLKDDQPQATYTVTLTYHNETTGEKSVDFMTFSVYRKAGGKTFQAGGIEVEKRGDKGADINALTVEQLNVEAGDYKGVNQIVLDGYVQDAGNPRVKWSARALNEEGEAVSGWIPVSGEIGSKTVQDENKKDRAKVEWLFGTDKESGQNYSVLGTDDRIYTGGAIRVTGLDVNEYDKEFTVELMAEAMEHDGEKAPFRTVTVTVMPKLKIDPSAKAVVSISSRACIFTANRDPDRDMNNWTFNWNWTGDKSNMRGVANDGKTYTVTPGDDKGETNMVTCQYGPHTVTANYTWQGIAQDLAVLINADHVVENAGGVLDGAARNDEYFVLEKGETRELELLWDNIRYHPYKSRSQSHACVTLIEDRSAALDPEESWIVGVPKDGKSEGYRKYAVTGESFTGGIEDDKHPGLEDLTWWVGNTRTGYDFHKYFAVVGMKIDKDRIKTDVDGKEVVFQDEGALQLDLGQSVDLSSFTEKSFAQELIWKENESDPDPEVTWSSDHPGLVSVDQKGVITAVKNGTASYAATITATYKVECKTGKAVNNNKEQTCKTYIFHDYINVAVEPSERMELDLDPCGEEDLGALKEAFGADLDSSSVLVPVQGTDENRKWTLIKDDRFGLDTLYFKVLATKTGSGDPVDMTEFLGVVMGDASYLEIATPKDEFYEKEENKTRPLYIRIRAREANVDEPKQTVSVEIGTERKTVDIYVYDVPKVVLTARNGTDVTNGSLSVGPASGMDVRLTAKLEPTLYDIREGKAPLDTIVWELQAPKGYESDRYLTPERDGDTMTVTLDAAAEKPDFRVVLRAYSQKAKAAGHEGLADAGYALVFLPEEKKAA